MLVKQAQFTVTRTEYDWLIANYTLFMSNEWPRIQKKWSLEGAIIQKESDFEYIQRFLNSAGAE